MMPNQWVYIGTSVPDALSYVCFESR